MFAIGVRILNQARKTAGKYLARRQGAFEKPAQTTGPRKKKSIFLAVPLAAYKWGRDPAFTSRYDFAERCRICYGALLLNNEGLTKATNKYGWAYSLAWRTLQKLYREEFPGREFQFDEVENENGERVSDIPDIGGSFQESDGTFKQSASPDAWSQMRSQEIEEFLQSEFDRCLRELPAAMASLDPVDRQILKMYYGIETLKLPMTRIADIVEKPYRTCYWHLKEGEQKLRQLLNIRLYAT